MKAARAEMSADRAEMRAARAELSADRAEMRAAGVLTELHWDPQPADHMLLGEVCRARLELVTW